MSDIKVLVLVGSLRKASINRQLAELAGSHELRRVNHVLATAPLRTHLHDAIMFLRRRQHRAPLIDRFRQRLFHVDVFAGLARQDCRQRVPMIRRRDQDYVHIFAVQHAAKIFYDFWPFISFILANLDALGAVGIVNVANDRAVNFRVQKKTFQVTAPHPARTDQPKPDLFAGRRLARTQGSEKWKTEAPCNQWSSAGGQNGFIQEFAAS